MKVYEIFPYSNEYQSLVSNHKDLWGLGGLMDFDGTSKLARWTKPDFRVYNPAKKLGDFIGVSAGSIGILPKAVDQIRTFAEMAGELLELSTNIGLVWCLNITESVDCLDHSRTEWIYGKDSGLPIKPKKLFFDENLMPESSLFKIPQNSRGAIYSYRGIKDSDDEFISCIEKCNLKGLTFRLVFDSENLSG